jgi:shikimate dehydrogenase
MIKLAVMGDPIAHSLSPSIHQNFAKQCGHDIEYRKIQVNKTQLPQALRDFWQQGGLGLNLTSPLKEEALQYCDELSAAAKAIGGVNTMHRLNDKTFGFNTDADGFLAALEQDDIAITDKSILILGAGGAAKAVGFALQQRGIKPCVYARRKAQAESLQQTIAETPHAYDVVVNTLARTAGLEAFQAAPVTACELAFDLNYDDPEGTFAQFAKQLGATRYVSGRNMLHAQAAKAYGIWTGAVVSF